MYWTLNEGRSPLLRKRKILIQHINPKDGVYKIYLKTSSTSHLNFNY